MARVTVIIIIIITMNKEREIFQIMGLDLYITTVGSLAHMTMIICTRNILVTTMGMGTAATKCTSMPMALTMTLTSTVIITTLITIWKAFFYIFWLIHWGVWVL